MLQSIPRGVTLTAAAFLSARALRSRRLRAKMPSASFDALSGIPARRPSKSEREAAAKDCLSKPRSAGAKREVKRMLLVVHGVKSLESKGKAELAKIRASAESRGVALVELVTERPGHCETLVRDADLADVDVVAVMGGDGTLREGVEGLRKRPAASSSAAVPPIVVFPCGTGNNFARDLGLFTIDDVFAALDRGVAHPADAVEVTHPGGTHLSVNCVTWGMARDAAETAEGMRWLGPVRYDVAGFYHILLNKLNFAKLAASADPDEPAYAKGEHEDYMMMFAQNTRCSGRGFAFTPEAKLDDGRFDLIAVRKAGTLKTVGLFDAVKAGGGHVQDPAVCYVQCASAALATKNPDDLVGIDGEVNVKTPVTLKCIEGAFRTFV
jgi:diacylglycerol kinase family enzyme